MSERMEEERGKDFNTIIGFLAWFLAVTGTVIASLPQLFVVQFNMPAGTSLIIGVPLVAVGAILLLVGWLPERRRKYPEVLENTETPIPSYYLELEEEQT